MTKLPKTFIRESASQLQDINNPVHLYLIDDGKDPLKDKTAYREVVLTKGAEVIDIVYYKRAYMAKHDYRKIESELITYGYEKAKELAQYIEHHHAMQCE